MYEKKYEVLLDKKIIAEGMSLETATILLKALFEKYYNDRFMVVSIREMQREGEENAED